MKKVHLTKVKLPTSAIKDSRKVVIGGYSATLRVRTAPKAVADSRKVSIGGYRITI
jgi:hypothetical protein